MNLLINIVLAVLAFLVLQMVLALVIPSANIVFLISLIVALIIVFGNASARFNR